MYIIQETELTSIATLIIKGSDSEDKEFKLVLNASQGLHTRLHCPLL